MSTNMKPIRGYEGLYMACESGRIWSVERKNDNGRVYGGIYLKPTIQHTGYEQVLLSKDGFVRHHKVHRLVCEAFHGHSYLQVNHINGIKADNRPSNLEWVTASENRKHAFEIGLCEKTKRIFADNRPRIGRETRVLSLSDALAVKIMQKAGYTYQKLGSMFGCSKSVIGAIIRNQTYQESFNV